MEQLSLSEARRMALAAQGFDRPRPNGPVGLAHLRRTIRQLGLLQIDTINIVARAHYQVLFSRLGPFDTARLDELVYRRREFTEQWAHEASIVPVEHWPLLRHRMETHRARPFGFDAFLKKHSDYAAWVLEEVRARGPLTADTLPVPDGAERRLSESWFGTVPRATLEAHFGRGELAVADRLPNFARTYDLAERVLPGHWETRVPKEEAQRELLRLAARAHGVATAADLANYHHMPVREARPRILELAEAGDLRPVRVEGWRDAAWVHRDARVPRRIDAAALLSPFDPVLWFRPRAERLFGFYYRVEIFVPEDKRRWGWYVLPFLLGDRLVARVDLRADRAARVLHVLAAYREDHAEPRATAEALAAELRALAAWQGLDSVAVQRRGDFYRPLKIAVMSSGDGLA